MVNVENGLKLKATHPAEVSFSRIFAAFAFTDSRHSIFHIWSFMIYNTTTLHTVICSCKLAYVLRVWQPWKQFLSWRYSLCLKSRKRRRFHDHTYHTEVAILFNVIYVSMLSFLPLWIGVYFERGSWRRSCSGNGFCVQCLEKMDAGVLHLLDYVYLNGRNFQDLNTSSLY